MLATIALLGIVTANRLASAQIAAAPLLQNPAFSEPGIQPLVPLPDVPRPAFSTDQSSGPTASDETSRIDPELAEELYRYFAMRQSSGMASEHDAPDSAEEGGDGLSASGRRNESQSGFDPSTVNRGRQFFESSCTQCHDAQRSTSKRKSYAGWLATVRRMAAKEDADISGGELVPIATYLASLNPANRGASSNGDDGGDMAAVDAGVPPFTLNGTVSPVWRGTDNAVENKGFFPDVWVGIEWRPEESPMSGRVVACSSCHGTNQGLGVELVEASVTLDLVHWLTHCPDSKRCPGSLEADLKAGRFIVPFGAFSSRVHPGALRTVSPPLMYNMGRRVGPIGTHQPVLNMPYSDEGFNIHLRRDLPHCCDWYATFDVYGVNGLQTGGPSVFFDSRSYRDNNSNVAVGGRATIGNQYLKVGGSIASGEQQFEFPGATLQNYKLAGGDVSIRWNDTLRAYYEYAIRDEDPFPGGRNLSYGHLVEAEILLLSDPQISLLGRYDTLENHGNLGDQFIDRFTWGLNFALYGGSTLILNHEHWSFDSRSSVNIMGIRWTMAF